MVKLNQQELKARGVAPCGSGLPRWGEAHADWIRVPLHRALPTANCPAMIRSRMSCGGANYRAKVGPVRLSQGTTSILHPPFRRTRPAITCTVDRGCRFGPTTRVVDLFVPADAPASTKEFSRQSTPVIDRTASTFILVIGTACCQLDGTVVWKNSN